MNGGTGAQEVSGGSGTGVSEAILTSFGSSAARLALGMKRGHGVVVELFVGPE